MVVLIIKLLSFPTASRYCYRFSRPFSRRVLDLYRPSLWQSCKQAAKCRARLLLAYFGLSSSPSRCTPIWSDGQLECLWAKSNMHGVDASNLAYSKLQKNNFFSGRSSFKHIEKVGVCMHGIFPMRSLKSPLCPSMAYLQELHGRSQQQSSNHNIL